MSGFITGMSGTPPSPPFTPYKTDTGAHTPFTPYKTDTHAHTHTHTLPRSHLIKQTHTHTHTLARP